VKRSKFTEDQIAFALKQNELGTSVDEVCRKMGISEATFYVWKKKYSGIGPSELRRLQLEEENRKLKQIVADLSLDRPCCRQWSQKSGPSHRRDLVSSSCGGLVAVSARTAVMQMSASTYLYRSITRIDGTEAAHQGITGRVHYGYRVHVMLRREATGQRQRVYGCTARKACR
jgi:putative transposase